MIRRYTTSILVAGVLLSAGSAQAQFISSNLEGGCGGISGGHISCALFKAAIISTNVSASNHGNNTLQFTIFNTSDGVGAYDPASRFSTIMLDNFMLSSGVTFDAAHSTEPSGLSGFYTDEHPAFPAETGFNNTTGNLVRAGTAGGNGLTPGGPYVIDFVFSGMITASQFANTQVAIFDQGGTSNCDGSNKVVFDGATGQAIETAATCMGPHTTTTPEPSAMALLGPGLVGLLPFRKRRS